MLTLLGGLPPDPSAPSSFRREDDVPTRDSLVPKGTFASEAAPAEARVRPPSEPRDVGSSSTAASTPGAIAPPAMREGASGREPSGRVVVARSSRGESTGDDASRAAERSTPRRTPAQARPPYLASEILREDLAPSEPGSATLIQLTSIAGALGLAAALFTGWNQPAGALVAAISTALLALARVRLSYATRATTIGSVAGVSLGIVGWWRVAAGASIDGPWLATATALLASALYFRSWYRGSNVARTLVGSSLVLAFAWAAMTARRDLLELAFSWSSILPALTWYLFVILCLLSLLAFMGEDTTGGCSAWAVGLFVWYACYALVRASMDSFTQASPTAVTAPAVLGLAEPVFAAPASVALAQLLARLLGPRRRAAERPHALPHAPRSSS